MRLACLVHIPFPKWAAVILAPVRSLSDTQWCWETKSKYMFGLQLALAASPLLLVKTDIVMLQSHRGVSPAWDLALNTSHGLIQIFPSLQNLCCKSRVRKQKCKRLFHQQTPYLVLWHLNLHQSCQRPNWSFVNKR